MDQVSLRREETQILSDISLHIKKGEHWALLGRNGSGKTSLLEIINGYMFPSTGKVHVLGETYGQCDLREIRKRIGYISQSLFEKMQPADPLWQAVASGEYAFLRFYTEIPAAVKEKAIERLRQVGLERLQDHPLGTLSQGERKKALLARALMQEPELLILDEPCSGLDIFEREKLLRVIEQIGAEKLSIVYVTHHLEEIMPFFTHAAVIEQGSVIASGEKREVLTEDNVRRAFDVNVDIDWTYGRPWLRVRGQ
nr:ATP-binding cassette domain-containing protein [Paenibacillus turpanensis]